MIAFGCAITSLDKYARFAEPGIRLAAESDSEVIPLQTTGSLFRNYNVLLDQAAKLDDLEALVILHQDAEIVDPDFCLKLREAISDPEVGVVGCAGALGVRSIAWWEGAVTWASFSHRYEEFGGGEVESLSWKEDDIPAFANVGEVDSIDGFVMVLSPWVVREIRFDESLGKFHGYDFDFCMQVRTAGRKIVTKDFRVVHNHSLELVNDVDTWVEAHIRVAEKWDGQIRLADPQNGDWKQRARRAEAEASVARAQAVSFQLKYEAVDEQNKKLTESTSWRLTTPLRWPRNVLARRRAQHT